MAYMISGEKKTFNVFFEMAKDVYGRIVYSPETGRLRVLNAGNIAVEIPAGILNNQNKRYDLESTGSDAIRVKSEDGSKQGIIYFSNLKAVVQNMPSSAKASLQGNVAILEDLVKAAEPLVM